MNINILHFYSLFGIAGGQEVDLNFFKFIIYPLTMIALFYGNFWCKSLVSSYQRSSKNRYKHLHIIFKDTDVFHL